MVLEDSFGLEVELHNGTNPDIFEAMDSGSMHVHPEVWLPNQTNLHDKFVKTRGTVRMHPNGVPSFQGMCVTRATADRTGITQISDPADPDMAKSFDANGDGRGEVWIGASGWASTSVEKIRAKSYGYDETMELVEMDETLAMADVDAAVAKDTDHVFYCYTPNHCVRAARSGDPRRARVRRLQADRHPAHRRSAVPPAARRRQGAPVSRDGGDDSAVPLRPVRVLALRIPANPITDSGVKPITEPNDPVRISSPDE